MRIGGEPTQVMTIRLAMWSGPRNISTAMMRSWENRADCEVIDEPFYACYLAETGLEHPCRDAVLHSQSSNRETVIDQLLAHTTSPIFYQKHMTHHMPEGCDMVWAKALTHVFLVRSPAQVIASYLNKMPTVNEADIGITRQLALFEELSDMQGKRPPVIDSVDVLRDPSSVLGKLCAELNIDFPEKSMTQWPRGGRPSDGVWANHWYKNVMASTGFSEPREAACSLSDEAQALADAMEPHYQKMMRYRLIA